ncbi:MAG: DNA polymerase III subunit alpha, partial [Methylococcales bacterium]|nr:DNA polymerase III subunit alpha [Methylococcales bacterium]
GPMDNIPSFVRRKHGQEPIQYPHEMLEVILKNTYGIMVYQEQIMQIAQKMGGYTLGGADLLRRAMGKKKMDVMKQERVNFNEGALKLGVTHEVSDSVFSLMEKFASYGFNKSHSAAYSVLAFKTAYMKAHYPKEYMAAVLTHNVNDIKKITFFIEECRRMGIKVLAPDVNESFRLFSVNKKGELRFGLSAIKGVGSGIVEDLIKERNENGPYTGIFDFTTRLAAHGLNRKTVESLVYGGGFDIFDVARYRYFLDSDGKGEMSVLDRSIQYGKKVHAEKNSMQMSLFGESGGGGGLEEPTIPIGTTREDGQGVREAWSKLQELKFEKDVIGFYLSGHPLDRYKWQIDTFCAAISD